MSDPIFVTDKGYKLEFHHIEGQTIWLTMPDVPELRDIFSNDVTEPFPVAQASVKDCFFRFPGIMRAVDSILKHTEYIASDAERTKFARMIIEESGIQQLVDACLFVMQHNEPELGREGVLTTEGYNRLRAAIARRDS